MKFSNSIQLSLCLFIMNAGIEAGINKITAFEEMPLDNELCQVKNTPAGTVCVQVMPAAMYTGDEKMDAYTIRVTLKSNQRLKQALMQYMNFAIKNSFRAVEGSDTLVCRVCERIPGINGNEFLYMACFNKPMSDTGHHNLRIYITDTLAGFGTIVFEIKKQALKKPATIKINE